MKLFTLIALMCMGLVQLAFSQEKIEAPRLNTMSYVIAFTAESGITFGFTDYKTSKLNFTGKGSLEYYFPSTGNGNVGIRAFAQTGFIGGQDARVPFGNPTSNFSTKIEMYGGGAIYMVNFGEEVYLWAAAGASNLWFYPKDGSGDKLVNYANKQYSNHMLAYNGDIGVRFMLSERISLNVASGIVVATKDWLDDAKYGSSNDMLLNGTVGLTYYIGRDKDTDKDGVIDSEDACPSTPQGVQVNETGCPLDTDKDGVADYLDKCPFTAEKVAVDANGCPLDADNDGIADNVDKCTNTPVGVKVDANGCPLDTDGDGVADYLDKCSNTPAKVSVDSKGCPIDADGDGVADYFDKCPNTPKGEQVDAEGCPIKKEVIVIQTPAEITSLVLNGDTNFEFNKVKLLPTAYAVLDSLVGTMKRHPEYKWEIGGYTDAVGSDNSNKKLSQRRAQVVVDYLISKGASKRNLKAVGYGETNPLTSNETVEGRSMNRRVEIKLLNK